MPDIFISYARYDRARVRPLVTALKQQGWEVWWDEDIVPGQDEGKLAVRIFAPLAVRKNDRKFTDK